MPDLIRAVNGVCGLQQIDHLREAPAGSVVVGNYDGRDKLVDGRFTYSLSEALEILENDKLERGYYSVVQKGTDNNA
jgi:hypothetical protein